MTLVRLIRIGVALAVLSLVLSASPVLAAPLGTLAATYQATPPTSAGAGTSIQVPVTVTNTSTAGETWNTSGTAPVNLSYHWYDGAGNVVSWDGVRTPLGADVPPAGTKTVTATVNVPSAAATYSLKFALVKEGVAWLAPSGAYPVQAVPAFAASFGAVTLPAFLAGATYTIPVTVTNRGTAAWNATGANLVDLAYHWHDAAGNTVVWDGVRSALSADVAVGASATVNASVTAPPAPGSYTLTFDLVREGISWFQFFGSAPSRTTGVGVANASYAVLYQVPASAAAVLGEAKTVAVTVTNNGNVTWSGSGANPVNIAYHVFTSAGQTVVWDGARTPLGSDLAPGASRTFTVAYTAPTSAGSYTLAIDTVREGVAWFSGKGTSFPSVPEQVVVPTFGAVYGVPAAYVGPRNATITVPVTLTNAGSLTWDPALKFDLAYDLFLPSGDVLVWDGARTLLSAPVAPGASVTVNATVTLPATPGSFALKFDLVQEGVSWFSGQGVPAESITLTIQ